MDKTIAELLVDSGLLDDISHDTLVAWLNGDESFAAAAQQILVEHG